MDIKEMYLTERPLIMMEDYFAANFEYAAQLGRNQKNRPIDPNHVNDFYRELERVRNFLVINPDKCAYGVVPIIVNKRTMHILDGQHKHKAYLDAIKNGLIPHHIRIAIAFADIAEENEAEEIIKLNQKSKNWSLQTYVGFHWYGGNENYKKLVNFAINHSMCKDDKIPNDKVAVDENGWPILSGINIRYAAAFLKLKPQQRALKMGEFEVTDKDLEFAEVFYNEISQILNFVWGDTKVDSSLEQVIPMWAKSRDVMSMSKLFKNLKKNKNIDNIKNGGKLAKTAWMAAMNPTL